uniref:MRG domain-containing protein n=1 Tax=Quercus lobata TaxID=97700 RepID=A0A7N2KRM6_QUELO
MTLLVRHDSMIPLDKLANIQIPPPLKKQLVDDCDFITHLGKLVKLPRAPNVDEILKKYLGYRLKKDNSERNSERITLLLRQSIASKWRQYFYIKVSVGRRQYKEAISVDVSPSTVYGAEHLCASWCQQYPLENEHRNQHYAIGKLQ